MMLTSCSDGPADAVTSMSPELRHIASREVVPPQAIVTSSAFCYSWNRVQVCMPLSARQMMTPNERGAMDQVIQDSVARLAEAGRLHISEINTSAVLPDLEGVEAVGRRQASMLAAPAHSAAGSSAQASPLLGVIHVDLEVAIPGTAVRLPPGDYAVRLRRSGTSRTAELTSAGNTRYQLPVTAVEVLGGATRPDVALVNLVFIFPSEELPTEQLCFFFEC
jgi:hypothetical protein